MNEEPIAVYEVKPSEAEFLQGACFLLRKSPKLRNLRVFGCVLPVLAELFFLFRAFTWEEIPGRRPVVHVLYAVYFLGHLYGTSCFFILFYYESGDYPHRKECLCTAKNECSRKS